ncbi:alpha/beta hydrolase [Bradyrhizobium sp. SYSU BS000235]|uniref:alpha/beta hydrolase n=1 Tax=Bradyrhizobium sp. SYSU BS000235 TaxID=3411332 RepID=UPI003C777CA0
MLSHTWQAPALSHPKMDTPVLYRGMDRAALNAAYNNTKAVADVQTIFADFRSRGAHLYETAPCERDLPYGDQPRQRFDLFRGRGANTPTMVYIHGGYWQTLSKEDFAFVAEGPLERGYNVVLAEYTLAPQASMTQIVEEIGRLLDHLAANRDALNMGRGSVCLVGHSAGGHLSLVHRSHPLLAHTMAISPLVDLEPIGLCWLNANLNLSPSEIDLYSPVRHIVKGAPTTIAVGAAELPELVRHASEYASAATESGEDVEYLATENRNHFTVLEDLASASGMLTKVLARTLSP